MIWPVDLIIMVLVMICGIGAIMVRDLLGAAILFGAYSFMMCLLWAIMGAVDVAFTEASVGAGVSSVFFVAAVFLFFCLVNPLIGSRGATSEPPSLPGATLTRPASYGIGTLSAFWLIERTYGFFV